MPNFTKRPGIGGLVMTRKVGERVIVNNGEIVIEVVEIRGRQARLAFKANKEITIRREEAPLGVKK